LVDRWPGIPVPAHNDDAPDGVSLHGVVTPDVWKDRIVRHNVVEGEPGMFPDPIARFMRKVGQLFDRKRKDDAPDAEADDRRSWAPDAEDP
jgi:hypothetical protein